MTLLQTIILAIVEGLTEFLPVSSTAHIRLTQSLLGIEAEDEFWKMFAIVIQLGAILAVLGYFVRRLRVLLLDFARPMESWRERLRHPISLVAISFVVTAVPCFLMDKLIGENLENFWIIGGALLVGGVVMWWVDVRYGERFDTRTLEGMNLRQAVGIGAAQILAAAFPGTSRSMATIAAGQLAGLSRPVALEFSFFLSIPVMFAATGYKLVQFVFEQPAGLTADRAAVLAIGFFVSFVVALVVIAALMAWVRRRGFVPFAIYRIAAGAVVLAFASQMVGGTLPASGAKPPQGVSDRRVEEPSGRISGTPDRFGSTATAYATDPRG